MSNIIRNIIMLVVFIVCLVLIIVGQKNISAMGLAMDFIYGMTAVSRVGG